jgi:hypothetical protein
VLFDALTLDAPKRTSDGFLAVRARAAKSGVYAYSGAEVDPENKHGLRDVASVNVLRDEATVFSPSSVRSFIGKPITDDHPTEAVTAANWRDHSRGVVMGAMRDGDHLAFDLVLMDAATIAKVEAGKVELSNGYSATLTHGDFTAADGTKCQFRQDSVVGNHCAIVDRGRAGPTCRIGDAAPCSSAPQALFDSLTADSAKGAIVWLKKAIALHKKHMNGTAPTTGSDGEKSQLLMMTQMENALSELETGSSGKSMKMDQFTDGAPTMKTMLIDGLTVDISNADTALATINTILAARDAATGKVVSLETAAVTDAATIVAKDAEIVKLTADLAAAKLTPQQMRDAAKVYAQIVAKAKASGVNVTDAMGEDEIMKAVVDKAMPGNTYAADHVAIAFAALTKDVNVTDAAIVPLHAPTNIADGAAIRDRIRSNRNAA